MGFYHFSSSFKEICIVKDENIFHFEILKVDYIINYEIISFKKNLLDQ